MSKIYSHEWFKERVTQANLRVATEWSDSMRANAVFASATLPQVSKTAEKSAAGSFTKLQQDKKRP